MLLFCFKQDISFQIYDYLATIKKIHKRDKSRSILILTVKDTALI